MYILQLSVLCNTLQFSLNVLERKVYNQSETYIVHAVRIAIHIGIIPVTSLESLQKQQIQGKLKLGQMLHI